MDMTIENEIVKIEADELDIYTVAELKESFEGFLGDGMEEITLDFGMVERISTPALQVLVSAEKSFDSFDMTNLQPDVIAAFAQLGINS